jgi:hypothetical protein
MDSLAAHLGSLSEERCERLLELGEPSCAVGLSADVLACSPEALLGAKRRDDHLVEVARGDRRPEERHLRMPFFDGHLEQTGGRRPAEVLGERHLAGCDLETMGVGP